MNISKKDNTTLLKIFNHVNEIDYIECEFLIRKKIYFDKFLKNITKGGFYLGNQGVLYSCNTTPNDNQFKNDPIWKLQTTSKSCPKDSTGNRVAPFNYTIMLSDMIEGNPKPTPPTPPTPNPADNMNINKAI